MFPSEFFSLQLSKNDLQELQRSLMARYLIEAHLRREQGLEPAPYPSLLKKLEDMLGMPEVDAQKLLQQTENELWEFSWFNYTDEWAWFRARQDVMKELGNEAARTKPSSIDELVESLHYEFFDTYVKEIDMKDEKVGKKEKKKK